MNVAQRECRYETESHATSYKNQCSIHPLEDRGEVAKSPLDCRQRKLCPTSPLPPFLSPTERKHPTSPRQGMYHMVILLLKQRVFQENVLQYCLGVLGTGNSSMSPLGRTNLHPKLPSFPALFQRNRLPSVLANRQRGTRRRDVIRAINPRCSVPDGIGERDRRNIQGNHFGGSLVLSSVAAE